jgi:MFS family permease
VGVGSDGVVSNNAKLGGIVAVYYFGVLFGCFWGGHLGDKLGRKKGVFLGTLWAMLGAALQSSAQNDNWMICGRVIAGVGTGHLVNIVPGESSSGIS